MAIASLVVVYYIPYTLQWCGNDHQWLENFENLCKELELHLKPNESFVRAPIDVKKRLPLLFICWDLLPSTEQLRICSA
jgi:hypothetical protein